MAIFAAIFESIWKRKETKIFLAFSCYPLIYFIASFFGDSNFMQITVDEGAKIGYLDFADIMFNTLDAMILPTLALYFLTLSVFKREVDDHTMFLYKDINRRSIFGAKYLSLALILMIYIGLFLLVTLFVHYTRVVQMPFGSSRLGADTLYNTLYAVLNIFTIFLKGILSLSIATVLSLRLQTGATIGLSIALSLVMMITGIIGGPIALIFPTGYMRLFQEVSDIWVVIGGSIAITGIYAVICHQLGLQRFKRLEF